MERRTGGRGRGPALRGSTAGYASRGDAKQATYGRTTRAHSMFRAANIRAARPRPYSVEARDKATMVTGLLRNEVCCLAQRSNGRYELFGIGEDGTSLSPSVTDAAGDDPILVHVLRVRCGWITEP